MSTRDIDRFALAELIHVNVCHRNLENCEGECDLTAKEAVTDGWSKPRTVNSAAELDKLADGSVVHCSTFTASKTGGWWFRVGTFYALNSENLLRKAEGRTPTVLFTPDGQP